jgi:hypothetical protein
MNFKQNKWYNLGDVNPREHGGVFVRRIGNSIEVVETHNNDGEYTISYKDDFVDYLKTRFNHFKTAPNETKGNWGVGSFADWGRYIKMEEDGVSLDDIVFHIATDMLSYYGGDSEPELGTNYWDLLGLYGITYRNYK